jgi:hypothetical protein
VERGSKTDPSQKMVAPQRNRVHNLTRRRRFLIVRHITQVIEQAQAIWTAHVIAVLILNREILESI